MSIVDRFFVGKVVKDFGVLAEKSLGIGKIKHRVLLVEKHGRYYFVLKASAWFLLSASVNYEKIPLENAQKLREIIAESETITKNLPPIDYDVSKVALRNSLITMLIASAINVFIQDGGVVLLTTLFAAFFHMGQFTEFNDHPDIDAKTKKSLFLIPLITLLIGVPKFCWLSIDALR